MPSSSSSLTSDTQDKEEVSAAPRATSSPSFLSLFFYYLNPLNLMRSTYAWLSHPSYEEETDDEEEEEEEETLDLTSDELPEETENTLTDPLILAAYAGDLEKVKSLFSHAPVAINENHDVDSAFHCAAKRGHEDVALFMIEQYPDLLNARNHLHETSNDLPLHSAAREGQIEIINLLAAFEVKRKINLKNHFDVKDDKILSEFFEQKNAYGNMALHLAAISDKPLLIDHLLSVYKVNIDSQNEEGKTALHLACEYGRTQALETLLKFECDLQIKDNDGLTALALAKQNGDENIVQVLLNQMSLEDKLDSFFNREETENKALSESSSPTCLLQFSADGKLAPASDLKENIVSPSSSARPNL